MSIIKDMGGVGAANPVLVLVKPKAGAEGQLKLMEGTR
jgi:hypothetical protein